MQSEHVQSWFYYVNAKTFCFNVFMNSTCIFSVSQLNENWKFQLKSYGGKLRFEVYSVVPRGNETSLPSGPDIILQVNTQTKHCSASNSQVILHSGFIQGFLFFVGRKYDLTSQIPDKARAHHNLPSGNYTERGKEYIFLNEVHMWITLWGNSLSITCTLCKNMHMRNTNLLFLETFTLNKVYFPNNLKSWQNHWMQRHIFEQKSDAICFDQNYFQMCIYNTYPLLIINVSS